MRTLDLGHHGTCLGCVAPTLACCGRRPVIAWASPGLPGSCFWREAARRPSCLCQELWLLLLSGPSALLLAVYPHTFCHACPHILSCSHSCPSAHARAACAARALELVASVPRTEPWYTHPPNHKPQTTDTPYHSYYQAHPLTHSSIPGLTYRCPRGWHSPTQAAAGYSLKRSCCSCGRVSCW